MDIIKGGGSQTNHVCLTASIWWRKWCGPSNIVEGEENVVVEKAHVVEDETYPGRSMHIGWCVKFVALAHRWAILHVSYFRCSWGYKVDGRGVLCCLCYFSFRD